MTRNRIINLALGAAAGYLASIFRVAPLLVAFAIGAIVSISFHLGYLDGYKDSM